MARYFTFVAHRGNILNTLKTNSFYRGERLKEDNGAHAARMQAGDDNEDVLKDELYSAATDVAGIITRNLGTCIMAEPGETVSGMEDEDEDTKLNFYRFFVTPVSNFPYEKLRNLVNRSIRCYMEDKTLEGWLLINMPGEVEALGQRALADAEKLRRILITREKPVR